MKTFFLRVRSIAAAVVVLLIGCVLIGIGLTVAGFLALFALAAIGLALIAAPFLARADDVEYHTHAETITLNEKPSAG